MVPWIGVCRVPVQHDEQAHEAKVMGERESPQDLFRFTTVMTRLAVVVSSDMIDLKNSEVPLFGQNPWN